MCKGLNAPELITVFRRRLPASNTRSSKELEAHPLQFWLDKRIGRSFEGPLQHVWTRKRSESRYLILIWQIMAPSSWRIGLSIVQVNTNIGGEQFSLLRIDRSVRFLSTRFHDARFHLPPLPWNVVFVFSNIPLPPFLFSFSLFLSFSFSPFFFFFFWIHNRLANRCWNFEKLIELQTTFRTSRESECVVSRDVARLELQYSRTRLPPVTVVKKLSQ